MRYLLSADLHIWDFKQHNPEAGFRLGQFYRVSEWWKELVSFYGLDAVIIAGDVVHQPALPPKVLATVLEFFRGFKVPVLAVHGQHDLDVRSDFSDPRSSVLYSLSRVYEGSFYYLEREYFQLGEDLIYGFGWRPELEWPRDLPKIPDLIIAHGSVKNAAFGELAKISAGYDPDSVPASKLAVVGDIHKAQRIGKVLIPGPPIHHTYSDSSAGVYLYDSRDGSLQLEEPGSVGGRKVYAFLTLKLDSELPEGAQEVDWSRLEVRRAPRTKKSLKGDFSKIREDWRATLERLMEAEGLLDLHRKLSASLKRRDEFPRGDFIPLRVEVRNYRSIGSLELEFPEGLLTVLGKNGSGKSSLVEAIRWCLYGGEGSSSLVKVGEEEMSVALELEYRGHHYRVERRWVGRQSLKVYQDGRELDAPSLRRKEELLEELFPWLNWWGTLAFYSQFRTGLLSGLSSKDRVDLISRIYGLDEIVDLYEVAKSERSELQGRLKAYRQQQQMLERLKSLEAQIRSEGITEELLKEEERRISELKAQIRDLTERHALLMEQRQIRTSEAREAQNGLQKLLEEESSLRDYLCPRCGSPLPEAQVGAMLEELEAQRKKLEEDFRKAVKASKKIKEDLEALESQLNGLRQEYEGLLVRYRDHHNLLQEYGWLRSSVESREEGLEEELRRYDRYLELIAPTGPGTRLVLQVVAEELSNDEWRVELERQSSSGKIRSHFSLAYRVGEDWLDYDTLSGGQRSLLDLLFLSKLLGSIGEVGLVVFDESFSHLDAEALERALNLLQSELPARTVIYISHHDTVRGQVLRVVHDGEGSRYELN